MLEEAWVTIPARGHAGTSWSSRQLVTGAVDFHLDVVVSTPHDRGVWKHVGVVVFGRVVRNFPDMYVGIPHSPDSNAIECEASKLGPCDCSRTPLLCGLRPVIIADRDRQQEDSEQLWVYRVPVAIHCPALGINTSGSTFPRDRIPQIVEVVEEDLGRAAAALD